MSEENASTHESENIDSMAGNMAGSLLGNQENPESNEHNEEEEEANNEENNEEENNNEEINEEENINEENNDEENNNEEENQNEENNEENKNQSEKGEGENKLDGMVDGVAGQLLGSQENKSEAHEPNQTPSNSKPHSRASQVRFSGNSSANRSQKSLNALNAQKTNNNQDNDHSKTMPPPAHVHEPSEGSQASGRSRKSQKSNATNQKQQSNQSTSAQSRNKNKDGIQEEEDLYYSQSDSEFQDEFGATGSSWANRLTRSELDDLVLSVITGETPIEKVPPSNLLQLISGLREARDERISRRKPDEAEVCDSCLLRARHAYNEHVKSVAQKNKIKEIEDRLKVAKDDLENLRDQIDLEDAQQASTNENQVMDLLDRQQADDDEFRKTWRSQKKLRIYNRTSNQLRSLKTQTILLLNARKYSEMRQVDRLAKKQEEIETADNYQQYTSEYIQSHQNLERKHMEEMKTLIDAQETKNEQKRALAKMKLDIAQKRVDNLQAQYNELKDPDKVWNLYYRNERSKAATKKSATRKRLETRNYATLALPPLQTPKSARSRSMRYSGI